MTHPKMFDVTYRRGWAAAAHGNPSPRVRYTDEQYKVWEEGYDAHIARFEAGKFNHDHPEFFYPKVTPYDR